MAHYRAAEPALARTLEGSALGYFYVSLGIAAVYAMHVGEALDAARRATEIAARSDDESLCAVAAGVHGVALKFTGRLREGREHLERCWEASDHREDRSLAYLSATNAGDWHEGYLYGGGDLYRRELARPRSASARNERAGLLHDLGAALVLNGKLTEARDLFKGGDSPEVAAILDFYDGSWDRAAETWEKNYDGFAATGNRYTYASRSYLLAEVYTAQGRSERAEQVLRSGLASATAAGPCAFMEMRLRPGLALNCAVNGKLDESREHLARCRVIMAAGEDWGRRAGRVELASGMLAARQGRHDELRIHLSAALKLFRERRLPWDHAETLFRWAQAAGSIADPQDATKMLREAHSIYRRISAAPAWSERLDREGSAECWAPVESGVLSAVQDGAAAPVAVYGTNA
jgi:tetratricopeptide (TPR) repeat protein